MVLQVSVNQGDPGYRGRSVPLRKVVHHHRLATTVYEGLGDNAADVPGSSGH